MNFKKIIKAARDKAAELKDAAVEKGSELADKAGEIRDTAIIKGMELVEKAQPIAEVIKNETTTAFNNVKDKLSKKDEAPEAETPKAEKPTTGSGLIDSIIPVVPPKKDDSKPAAPAQ
jgi:microcompartment protein CcmL/EutN